MTVYPGDVDSAVSALKVVLSAYARDQIARTPESSLSNVSSDIGIELYEDFGLGTGNDALFASCSGATDYHDAELIILKRLRDSLRNERPDHDTLDEMESRLNVRIEPFPVRNMTFADFAAELNRRTNEALTRSGSATGLSFVVSYTSEEERRQEESLRLNSMPCEKVWGVASALEHNTLPVSALIYNMDARLVPPSTVEIHPARLINWMDLSIPHWEVIQWDGDCFEARSAISVWKGDLADNVFIGNDPEDYRYMTWTMSANEPPMQMGEALRLFFASRFAERGETPVCITISNLNDRRSTETDPVTSRSRPHSPHIPESWEYSVVSSLHNLDRHERLNANTQTFLILSGDRRMSSTISADSFAGIPVSENLLSVPGPTTMKVFEIAVDYLRSLGLTPDLSRKEISLNYLSHAENWFFTVTLCYPLGSKEVWTEVIVLPDGRVIPFAEDHGRDELTSFPTSPSE